MCNNTHIKVSDEVKYLGIKLDKCLSCNSIVKAILHKCKSRLKFVYRHNDVLVGNVRKVICTSLIQSHFDYGISAWYPGLTKHLKQKLQIAQNKMARFILRSGPRSHIGHSELHNLGFLNVQERYRQLTLNHMFKVYQGSAPSYLSDKFTPTSSVHSYSTRGSESNFIVPNVKGISKLNFSYQYYLLGTASLF